MYFNSESTFARTDIWREGNWLDLWSVVHFLSGVTMGFFPKYLGLEMLSAYAIAFLLLVLYEMFEALVKIKETRTNRIMDVVVGMASFIPAYHLHPFLAEPMSMWLFGMFFVAASVLGAVGWHASRKAAVFETKLKAEIAFGRQKLKEKRAKLAKRLRM